MTIYDASWDRPHAPDERALWQESDWLTFYDPAAQAGATFRVGRQPNRGKGQPSLFCFALGGQRFYLQDIGGRGLDCDVPPSDVRAGGCTVAGHAVDALGDGRMRYAWHYPETEGELHFSDAIYTPRGWSATGAGSEVMAWLNPDGHLECAGRLVGRMRIGAMHYAIDCFAHRDRSWGYRENYLARMRRAGGAWGSNGAGLTFASTMLDVRDGERLALGFVVRHGHQEDIVDLRYLSLLDEDMASPVGGVLLFELASGEAIRVDCAIAQAFGGYAPGGSYSALGTFVHAGETGFCNLSATADPGGASRRYGVADVTSLTVAPGLSDSAALPR